MGYNSISKGLFLGLLLTLCGCKLDRSVQKNFNTFLLTKGNGLATTKAYIERNGERENDNVFIYGDNIHTYFEQITGFTEIDGSYFPKMEVLVTTKKGDTVMFNKDLLKAANGFDAAKTTLFGELILAKPFTSSETYTVNYRITDTKGEGSFISKMDFKLDRDPGIAFKNSGLGFQEAYVFNTREKKVISNGKMAFGDKIQFQFEGLYGYQVVSDTVLWVCPLRWLIAKGNVFYTRKMFLPTHVLKTIR